MIADASIYEQIGQLKGAVAACHNRVDDLNVNIRDSLKVIHEKLVGIEAYMNHTKGATGASKWIIGTLLVVIGMLCGILGPKL